MSYTIELSNDRSCVILTVKGDISRRTALKQNLESHAFGRDHGPVLNSFAYKSRPHRNKNAHSISVSESQGCIQRPVS